MEGGVGSRQQPLHTGNTLLLVLCSKYSSLPFKLLPVVLHGALLLWSLRAVQSHGSPIRHAYAVDRSVRASKGPKVSLDDRRPALGRIYGGHHTGMAWHWRYSQFERERLQNGVSWTCPS